MISTWKQNEFYQGKDQKETGFSERKSKGKGVIINLILVLANILTAFKTFK